MKYLFLCIFLSQLSVVYSQQDLISSTTDTRNVLTMEAYDYSGKRIPTGDRVPVQGSTMLNDEFVKGVVKFKSGQQYKDVLLNLSLVSNEIYFKKDSISLTFLYPVEEFSLAGSGKATEKIIYFKSGYPATGKNTDKTFYQSLANGGKIHLLKYLYKVVQDHYEYGGPSQKIYVLKERYYIFDAVNNKIAEVSLNSNAFKKALPAYAKYIDRYVSEDKANFKDEENVISLVNFINQQP